MEQRRRSLTARRSSLSADSSPIGVGFGPWPALPPIQQHHLQYLDQDQLQPQLGAKNYRWGKERSAHVRNRQEQMRLNKVLENIDVQERAFVNLFNKEIHVAEAAAQTALAAASALQSTTVADRVGLSGRSRSFATRAALNVNANSGGGGLNGSFRQTHSYSSPTIVDLASGVDDDSDPEIAHQPATPLLGIDWEITTGIPTADLPRSLSLPETGRLLRPVKTPEVVSGNASPIAEVVLQSSVNSRSSSSLESDDAAKTAARTSATPCRQQKTCRLENSVQVDKQVQLRTAPEAELATRTGLQDQKNSSRNGKKGVTPIIFIESPSTTESTFVTGVQKSSATVQRPLSAGGGRTDYTVENDVIGTRSSPSTATVLEQAGRVVVGDERECRGTNQLRSQSASHLPSLGITDSIKADLSDESQSSPERTARSKSQHTDQASISPSPHVHPTSSRLSTARSSAKSRRAMELDEQKDALNTVEKTSVSLNRKFGSITSRSTRKEQTSVSDAGDSATTTTTELPPRTTETLRSRTAVAARTLRKLSLPVAASCSTMPTTDTVSPCGHRRDSAAAMTSLDDPETRLRRELRDLERQRRRREQKSAAMKAERERAIVNERSKYDVLLTARLEQFFDRLQTTISDQRQPPSPQQQQQQQQRRQEEDKELFVSSGATRAPPAASSGASAGFNTATAEDAFATERKESDQSLRNEAEPRNNGDSKRTSGTTRKD